ncbi:MAG: hypothetical protein IIY21_28105 [Clostridiales bacterium]|nr:hypothetical protein [Clostridiales bacterium]
MNAISQGLSDVDDRVILLAGDVIEKAHDIMELSENPPYIGANGNWYVWDTNTGAYVDSGVDASISVEIADVTMLPVGSTPYVTNTGTATDPVFHLFIPMGNDGDYNNLGNRPKINGTTLSGSGQGNSYALTDISMVAKYMPSTDIVPTGQTYEKGAIVWIKGLYGQNLRRMNEDAAAGSNWVNKSSAVTLNDLINALYANLDSEVITRASLGAHNLLPCTMTSHSRSGVSATVNADGTITLNNTSTGSNVFPIADSNLSLKAGRYIFTCLQTTGSDATFKAYVSNLGDYVNYFDYGSGVEFEVNHDVTNAYVGVMFASGVSFNNQVLKPMIRLASDSDSTYQPYVKTNKQLTDNVKDIETAIAPIEIGTASQAYDKGDYLIMNDKLYKATTAIVSGATLTVGTNIVQTSVAEELELNNIQLELTGISTNKGIIEGVFTNVIPLLTRDLMKCSGVVKVPGANSFGFNVFRISSTMYYGFFHANDRVFTAVSSSGTVTAYQIVGTAI